MFRPALLTAPVLLMTWASVSVAACPQNHFSIGLFDGFSSLPVDTRTFETSAPYYQYSSASYNVPVGTLSLAIHTATEPEVDGGVYVEDDFTVIGPPGGTEVSLTAHMTGQLRGVDSSPTVAFVQATLEDLNGNIQIAATPALDYDLSLPVTTIVGTTFRLHFELSGYAVAHFATPSGTGNAAFSFAGLPPGAMVTSCQGYASGPPVATRPMTWGRVKTIYR